jgi:hypothetical protein
MRDFMRLFAIAAVLAGCGKTEGSSGSDGLPTCTDQQGVTHASGDSWMQGCASCSCGDQGGGKLVATCTHNVCPPDASDGPGDEPVDWNATVPCGDTTCGAGEVCRGLGGDADASVTSFDCVPGCQGKSLCSCVSCMNITPYLCNVATPRQVSCGISCAFTPDVGCFAGAACRSDRVDPLCINGRWTCPTDASATDACPPDAGNDGPQDAARDSSGN